MLLICEWDSIFLSIICFLKIKYILKVYGGVMSLKRAISYSESHIQLGDYKFDDKIIPLIQSERKLLAAPDSPIILSEPVLVIVKTPSNIFGIFIDYSTRFVFHLFLISIFEVAFYFAFVAKDEDNGILNTTNYYTNSIINSCTNLTATEIVYIDSFLYKIINATQILNDGQDAQIRRNSINSRIYKLACGYIGILAGLQIILLSVSYYNKFKIRWTAVLLENFALVMFLGIYEYMFFITIITNYSAESPQEISALFITGLQNECKLLT